MQRELKSEIDLVKKRHKGITPEALVTYAQDNPDSVLHRYFEWDDETAAYAYRLEQARGLLREYKILKPGGSVMVRGLVSVPSGTETPRKYYDYASVIGSEVLRLERSLDAMSRHIGELQDLQLPELTEQLLRSRKLQADLLDRLERLREPDAA